MTAEKWKPVRGYEGLYSVSNLGRIRGEDRRRKSWAWLDMGVSP